MGFILAASAVLLALILLAAIIGSVGKRMARTAMRGKIATESGLNLNVEFISYNGKSAIAANRKEKRIMLVDPEREISLLSFSDIKESKLHYEYDQSIGGFGVDDPKTEEVEGMEQSKFDSKFKKVKVLELWVSTAQGLFKIRFFNAAYHFGQYSTLLSNFYFEKYLEKAKAWDRLLKNEIIA